MYEIPVVLENGGWVNRDANPATLASDAAQVCHARVGARPAERRFTIFFSNGRWPASSPARDALAAIAAAHGGVPVFLSDASGESEAQVESSGLPDIEAVAAAGAVMRASWAWDERTAIPVIVNGVRRIYRPRFDGRTWVAGPGE